MAKQISFSPYNQQHKTTLASKTYGNQTVVGRVNASIDLTAATFVGGDKRFLHVSLDGTEVSPGVVMKDQNDMRGFFLDYVETRIWLEPSAAEMKARMNTLPPLPGNLMPTSPGYQSWLKAVAAAVQPLAGYVVKADAPDTPNQSGSITSSISFSVNESAGFFGPVPTANVSGGLTIGQSVSHIITDFTWEKILTDDQHVHHKCYMTSTRGGDAYDIHDTGSMANGWQSPFVGARLRELPHLAVSSVPLPIQAIFMNQNDAGLAVGEATLVIAISARYTLVEGTNDAVVISTTGAQGTAEWTDRIPIDLTAADA